MNQKVTGPGRLAPWFVRFPRAVPLGIFTLVTSVTCLSVFAIEKVEAERARSEVHDATRAVAFALDRRASSHLAYLRAGAVLFEATGINQSTFRKFANQLQRDMSYRGAEAIGWAERVSFANVASFESRMRAEGSPSFHIYPAPSPRTPIVIPVTYVEPQSTQNVSAVGYNMHSEPVRRHALAMAERNGGPTVTGMVRLMLSGPKKGARGFVIYMPVALEGGNVRGFLYSPFSAQEFLDAALDRNDRGDFVVRLYDGTTSPDRLLAVRSGGGGGGARYDLPVVLGEHRFVLSLTGPKPRFLSTMSLFALAAGLLAAILLTAVARLVTRQAAEDRLALNWFEEQASIRNSLTRELNHRVKNTLANVLSIISLTRRRETDLDNFADSLSGRIRALSATHDLLTKSEWGATPVRAVVDAELAPYAQWGEKTVVASGPDVELAPNDALSLGLALHELATNASKYGALSAINGQVEVRWQMIAPALARIEWSEHGGPPVADQRKRGFGLELIEKIVAHELKNPVDLRFEREGVRCSLVVPVRPPAAFQLRAARAAGEVAPAAKRAAS